MGEADEGLEPYGVRVVTLAEPGGRIDKVLADRVPEMSRARLQALIAEGELVNARPTSPACATGAR